MDQVFSPRLLPDRSPTASFNQLSMNTFHHQKKTALAYECINNSSNNNSHLIHNNNNVLSPVPMSTIKMERDDGFDSSSSSDLMSCKRSKQQFSPSSFSVNGNPPVAARRNERERNRVKQVNMGFSTLRQRVPDGVKNKKMSKVETLRSAVEYIKKLQKMLNESAASAEGMMTMCGSRDSTGPASSCTPDSAVSYQHAASSGRDVDSSPLSSTSPSSVMETSDISYHENDGRERCFPGSDDDIISFSKWFS